LVSRSSRPLGDRRLTKTRDLTAVSTSEFVSFHHPSPELQNGQGLRDEPAVTRKVAGHWGRTSTRPVPVMGLVAAHMGCCGITGMNCQRHISRSANGHADLRSRDRRLGMATSSPGIAGPGRVKDSEHRVKLAYSSHGLLGLGTPPRSDVAYYHWLKRMRGAVSRALRPSCR
jgi:hypothetical protein